MFFLFKVILSGVIIALASKWASKDTALAGFLVALPLVSMLSILFAYAETRDVGKISQFAGAIFLAVPLSLTFFVPFLLQRWTQTNFWATYFLGLGFLTCAYILHRLISKAFLN